MLKFYFKVTLLTAVLSTTVCNLSDHSSGTFPRTPHSTGGWMYDNLIRLDTPNVLRTEHMPPLTLALERYLPRIIIAPGVQGSE